MKKLLFLPLALAICLPASSSIKQIKIKIKDISEKGSPMRISGYVNFQDDDSERFRFSYQISSRAVNISNKNILLMVIHYEANGGSGPGDSQTYTQDYFFSAALKPGEIDSNDDTPFRPGLPTVNGAVVTDFGGSSHSTATAELQFVQFSDGSTWGDSDSGKEALDYRKHTLDYMNTLDQIYYDEGGKAFLNKLDDLVKSGLGSSMWIIKDRCKQNPNDAECPHVLMMKMMEAAKERQMIFDEHIKASKNAFR